jgi:hypothetical protein
MVLFSNFCVYCCKGNASGEGAFYVIVLWVATVISTNDR